MKKEHGLNSWLWLMQAEDSSMAEERTDLFLAIARHKELIMSAAKLILWYGTAISLGLLIANLH